MNNKYPEPAEVRAARKAARLTQTEAAALVYVTQRAWAYYEAGKRNMPPASWELFLQKAKLVS